jgi:Pyruvate/2-oxoglutarate dehydrogenase complex, dehydrogenase (E1) component, eukaryotic type, alpha subunit
MPRKKKVEHAIKEALPKTIARRSAPNGQLQGALVWAYEGDLDLRPVSPADFEEHTLLSVYRTMLLARRLDEKMLTLLKQGKGFFHIGGAGHEAAQAAAGLLSKPGYDWFILYYRDLCMYLSLGGRPEDVLLAHLAKANDPNSGGRQMPAHYSDREKHIVTPSSSVALSFCPH